MKDFEVILTKHSIKRMGQRLGLKKKSCRRQAQAAFDCGLKLEDVKGALNSLLNAIYLKYRAARNLRVYNKHIYVFDKNVLITVLKVSNKFYRVFKKV